jgi:diguanylate cyclase (GGDEF)-like protein/PAS domain S-box-containing protein
MLRDSLPRPCCTPTVRVVATARSFIRIGPPRPDSEIGVHADDKCVGSDGMRPLRSAEVALPRPVALFGSFRYGQYYEDLLAGAVAAATSAGSSVIAVQTWAGGWPNRFELDWEDGASRAAWDHFDGAIVILSAVSLDYVARLRAAGKFVVAIGQELRGTHAAITLDNAGGVSAVVTHLASHGHTMIGCVAPTWQADALERYAAYRECMGRLGLTALPRMGPDLPTKLSWDEQGYLAAQQFLAGDRLCTALLVEPDLIALGFIRGLQEAGVAVPGDVAVVGIDDVHAAAVSVPPLATVAISFQQVGELAFNVALRGGRGEAMQTRYVVPQRFVPRESCGCPATLGAQGAADTGSPVEVFVRALVEAAQDGVPESSVDTANVARLGHRMVAFLSPPVAWETADDRPTVEVLAAEIIDHCPLDRSVQAVLLAIQVLAQALADALHDQQPVRTWTLSCRTRDLREAIHSGQLQRRMTEYVALKRMQESHYYIGYGLLGKERADLRSLGWLQETGAQVGALGVWTPADNRDRVTLQGVYDRTCTGRAIEPPDKDAAPVESFPPRWMLRDAGGVGRLLLLTQVRFEDSDWGLLAVAGGRALQSVSAQQTFQHWAILMSVSLDQEKAEADLALQAAKLTTAYETEVALLEEVRVSEERYALAAEAAHDALWDWDIASGKLFYSSSWKALLGYRDHQVGTTPDEWLGRIHPDDAQQVQEQLDRALEGVEQYLDFEHRLQASTGEYRWIACSGRSVLDGHGRPKRLVGSITDVTVRRLLQEQLLQEAMFDGLTGLAKGTLFKDRINQAIELGKRRPDYWFAVLFLDLDGFKAVNDNLGHAAGDELLASVARRLIESLRKNDTAARLGGDEFAILLNDVGHVSDLPITIKRIQSLIGAPYQVGGETVRVGMAIGAAVSSDGYETADAMLLDADAAMYRAKRHSRAAARDAVARRSGREFAVVRARTTASARTSAGSAHECPPLAAGA